MLTKHSAETQQLTGLTLISYSVFPVDVFSFFVLLFVQCISISQLELGVGTSKIEIRTVSI